MTSLASEYAEALDSMTSRRVELVRIVERFAPDFGVHPTAIQPLHLIRSDQPTQTIHTVHKPGLCKEQKKFSWRKNATATIRFTISWFPLPCRWQAR